MTLGSFPARGDVLSLGRRTASPPSDKVSLGGTADADPEADRRAPRPDSDDERSTGWRAQVEASRVDVPLVRLARAHGNGEGRDRAAVTPVDRNSISPRLWDADADTLRACADE